MVRVPMRFWVMAESRSVADAAAARRSGRKRENRIPMVEIYHACVGENHAVQAERFFDVAFWQLDVCRGPGLNVGNGREFRAQITEHQGVLAGMVDGSGACH